ncbi:hypothetical protein [Kitasatospora sp. NPDC059599]
MTTMTHTYPPGSGEGPWPDGSHVWNWVETVLLWGYGPGAWFFV